MPVPPIIATYLVETPHSVEMVAETIAGEQSSGTFLTVPGETDELKARARAQVLEITILGTAGHGALPGVTRTKNAAGTLKFQRAKIKIAFPYDNIGNNLPTLMATVCGNLYEVSSLSGCKLLDLELPEEFAKRYPGPQFGVAGTRRLTSVAERPIVGTIVKPSVGLTPEQTAELVRELCEAGIDFIKDDELMANPPHSPVAKRVECVMREINRAADKLGRKVMYAVNITDEVDSMRRHHDMVMEAGGTCVMVSLNQVGLAGVSALRAVSQLPIHGHRNGWGMLNRHPLLGIEYPAYQKVWRAVGIDHMHVNGLQNKFWESDDSVVASVEALRKPLWGGYEAMPVISSGQWGGQAPMTLHRTGTQDVIYVAGGGMMAHPSGPAAGLRGIRQAWEAAAAGITLEEYSRTHSELREAMEKFGGSK